MQGGGEGGGGGGCAVAPLSEEGRGKAVGRDVSCSVALTEFRVFKYRRRSPRPPILLFFAKVECVESY